MSKQRLPLFIAVFFIVAVTGIYLLIKNPIPFNEKRAFADLQYQVSLGPRTPGSKAHETTVSWLVASLQKSGWDVFVQELVWDNHPIKNVIAKRGEGPIVLLGAHYDSRMMADHDPNQELAILPVPGANDGASGVAVLLELARILPNNLNNQIWLVFFDAEDQGNLPGWDWILGSRAFVANMDVVPESVVIVDMVGDKDLSFVKERQSDILLTNEIWESAHNLGYQQIFKDTGTLSILDDHIPFIEAGIPATDIIDFTYPSWHTSGDSVDKTSPESLGIVGRTLYHWLVNR